MLTVSSCPIRIVKTQFFCIYRSKNPRPCQKSSPLWSFFCVILKNPTRSISDVLKIPQLSPAGGEGSLQPPQCHWRRVVPAVAKLLQQPPLRRPAATTIPSWKFKKGVNGIVLGYSWDMSGILMRYEWDMNEIYSGIYIVGYFLWDMSNEISTIFESPQENLDVWQRQLLKWGLMGVSKDGTYEF